MLVKGRWDNYTTAEYTRKVPSERSLVRQRGVELSASACPGPTETTLASSLTSEHSRRITEPDGQEPRHHHLRRFLNRRGGHHGLPSQIPRSTSSKYRCRSFRTPPRTYTQTSHKAYEFVAYFQGKKVKHTSLRRVNRRPSDQIGTAQFFSPGRASSTVCQENPGIPTGSHETPNPVFRMR